MKSRFTIFTFLMGFLVAVPAFSQDKPAPGKNCPGGQIMDANGTCNTPIPPQMPDKNRADILEIKVRMLQEQTSYQQLQLQIKEVGDNFQKDAAELAKAQKEVCTDPGWELDVQTVKCVKKATLPLATPPPAPAKKQQ